MAEAKAISVGATTPNKADEVATTNLGIPEYGYLEPTVPETWNYKDVVSGLKTKLLSFKNMTEPLMEQLSIARQIMKSKDLKKKFNIRTDKTWKEFCRELGTSQQVINRWLKAHYELTDSEHPTPVTTKAGEFDVTETRDGTEISRHLYAVKGVRTYSNGNVRYSYYVTATNPEESTEEPTEENTEPNTETTEEATE